MDDLDNLIDVNDHTLSGNNLENHMDTNGTERTSYGDDEVEIVVCSVTSETETESMGEFQALGTPLNSYKFDIDGTVYTFIVDLEASLKKDEIKKDRHHEEKVVPTNDDLLLPLNQDSSVSEDEGGHKVENSVDSMNGLEEEVSSIKDNLICINENSVIIVNEQHVESLNVTGNSLTKQGGRTWNNLPADDDADNIVNEQERVVSIVEDNSVSIVNEQEEKCIVLKETIGVDDDKENDSHVATPPDESPFPVMLNTKNQEHDSLSNIQKRSKKYNRKQRDNHICKTRTYSLKQNLARHMTLHKGNNTVSCEALSKNEKANLLISESDKAGDDLLMNDDSVGIVNEMERTTIAKENSVTNLVKREEKDMLLRKTVNVYDDKKNDSHVATPWDEWTFHRMLSSKKEEHDSISNIQKKPLECSHNPINKNICETCDRQFSSSYTLKRHSYLHKPDRQLLACKVCSRTFVWKHNLYVHMKYCAGNGQYKSDRPSFACNVCQRKFYWKKDLTRHMKICTGNGQYKSDRPSFTCNVCSRKYFWKHNLVKHMKICKGNGQSKYDKPSFACNVCSRTFVWKRNLNVHMKFCTGNGQYFVCNVCQRKYFWKQSLTKHMNLHVGNSTVSCGICSKNLSGKYELGRHMLIHSKFKQLVCDICMQTFSQKDNLTKHIEDHFKLDDFECKICLVQFSNESSLICHMSEHPDQNHKNLDSVAKLEKQQQHQNELDSYTCDFCLQSFNRKTSLVKHLELHCRLDTHSCEICYEECSNQSSLNSHMAIHLLAKDDSVPCVYEQDNSPWVAKSDSMSNVYEHETDNLISRVEEHERKDIGIKYDSVLSVISQEEKLTLVKEIVNELKGGAIHVNDNFMSRVNKETTNIGNTVTASQTENLKYIKTKDDSMTVSNLIKQEGKDLFWENELSVEEENEQDSYEAAQDFEFPIHNPPIVIKRENGSVSNVHEQIKLKRPKLEPLQSHTCETCYKRFSSALCLKRHYVVHEADRSSFTCKVCSRKFTRKGDLTRHMKVHGICGFCWKQYSRRKDLDLHMRTVHSTKPQPYFCDLCSQTFFSRYYLVRHIEDHVRVGKVVCKFCSIQFPNKSSLGHHMRGHLDGENLRQSFYCNVCSQNFDSKTSLGIHVKKHHRLDNHSCPVCQKQFLNGDTFNRHMSVHLDNKRQTLLCDLCPKTFSSQKHLTNHRRNHSRDKSDLTRHMIPQLSSDQSKLYCYQCLQQYDTISDYTLHMQQHEGSHTCAICSQVFSFKSNLKRHVIQYHFKLGLIYCQICGKGTWNKSDLSRHMIAMHSGNN